MNLQSLASSGIVASMLAGLLPLHLVRQKLVSAEREGRQVYALLAIRIALGIFIGLAVPLMFVASIPHLSPTLNIEFVWLLAVGAAWLPATSFLVIGAIMLARGVEAFISPERKPSSRAALNLAWHRKAALTVASLLAASLWGLFQIWGMDNAEAWAESHPAQHFAISVPWAIAFMYVVWVLIEHVNPTARNNNDEGR